MGARVLSAKSERTSHASHKLSNQQTSEDDMDVTDVTNEAISNYNVSRKPTYKDAATSKSQSKATNSEQIRHTQSVKPNDVKPSTKTTTTSHSTPHPVFFPPLALKLEKERLIVRWRMIQTVCRMRLVWKFQFHLGILSLATSV